MLAVKQAQLFIPPRSNQFSKDEIFETMRIANLRKHAERAIKRVKGWHIFLPGPIPQDGWRDKSSLGCLLCFNKLAETCSHLLTRCPRYETISESN